MQKIKYTLASIGASLALMLGLAIPAGAQQTCTNQDIALGVAGCMQVDSHDDNSDTDNDSIGNCSLRGDIEAGDGGDGGNGAGVGSGTGVGTGVLGDGTGTGTGTGTGSGGNGGNGGDATFSPDCSTNNVTNVTNQQVLAASTTAQVSAPKGAVSAGAGGAATSSVGSVLAMAGSVVTMGLGFAVRKFNV